MISNSRLTRGDYEDYLVYLYFHVRPSVGTKQYLEACIKRAYLDFNRTLRGLEAIDRPRKIYGQAAGGLRPVLMELRNRCAGGVGKGQFDEWHHAACSTLISIYKQHSFPFTFGQAQKWINMSLKYVFVLGEARVSGFIRAYQSCHAPLDGILLEMLSRLDGFPKVERPWSKLDDYAEYLDVQMWIRDKFDPLPPLDVEFKLWMGEKVQ